MKVGKAIYNILSQSTDVQSNFPFNTTDYSPTGTELVTNGDFSATGSNLVDNPNFTETGSELAVALTSWTSYELGTSTVTYEGSIAELNISASNSNVGIYQENIFSVGKSYKIVLSMKATASFDAEILEANNASTESTIGTASLTTSYQDFTYYFTATGTFDLFIHRLFSASGASQTISIQSVSVKELGADWTDTGTPLKAATFEANGLTITSVNGDGNFNRVYQTNVTEDSKSYKVTYTIHSATLTGSNVFQYYNGQAFVTLPTAITGTPQTFYFTRKATDDNWYFRVATYDGSTTDFVTISSIVVQELGEGWDVQEGWIIGEDKAICDGSTNNYVRQVLSLPVGNLKVTLQVDSYTSGTLKLWANLPAFTTIITATSANTYEAYIKTTSGANNLYFYSVAFIGSITNISVEEMAVNKIFPELAPPDIDAPYVVYSVVSNSPSDTKNANGDIDTASIEVYGFQDTYNKAVDLGVSIRAALDRKTGTYNTIEIQSTNYVNEQMDVNEARKLWAAIQDYSIRIKNI